MNDEYGRTIWCEQCGEEPAEVIGEHANLCRSCDLVLKEYNQKENIMADWKLIVAEDVEATIDDSGLYVVINRVESTAADLAGNLTQPVVQVRADLMGPGDEPLVSYIGTANNVRKNLVRFLEEHFGGLNHVSTEHASYIGYELLRAEKESGFTQD